MGYIDLNKMYDNGIDALYMGGEILDGSFYREKDIMEDNYSSPVVSGKCKILEEKLVNGFHVVRFQNNSGLTLSDREYKVGYVAD